MTCVLWRRLNAQPAQLFAPPGRNAGGARRSTTRSVIATRRFAMFCAPVVHDEPSLGQAAMASHLTGAQVVDFLTEKGAMRGQRVVEVANSQLVEAAAAGDVSSVRRAIADGADVNRGDYDLRTVHLLPRRSLATSCHPLPSARPLTSSVGVHAADASRSKRGATRSRRAAAGRVRRRCEPC